MPVVNQKMSVNELRDFIFKTLSVIAYKVFRTEELLKYHIKYSFQFNCKQRISMPQDNRKHNLEEVYTNKYQKHIACSYDHKLVCWW